MTRKLNRAFHAIEYGSRQEGMNAIGSPVRPPSPKALRTHFRRAANTDWIDSPPILTSFEISHGVIRRPKRTIAANNIETPIEPSPASSPSPQQSAVAIGGLRALNTTQSEEILVDGFKRAITDGSEIADLFLKVLPFRHVDLGPLIRWLWTQHEDLGSRSAQLALASLSSHLKRHEQRSVLRGLCAHATLPPRIDWLASADLNEVMYEPPTLMFDNLSDAIARIPIASEEGGIEVIQTALSETHNPLRWILLRAASELRPHNDSWIVEELLRALRSKHSIEVSVALHAFAVRYRPLSSQLSDRICEALLDNEGVFAEHVTTATSVGLPRFLNVTASQHSYIDYCLVSEDTLRRRAAIQTMGLMATPLTENEIDALKSGIRDSRLADVALRTLCSQQIPLGAPEAELCVQLLADGEFKVGEAALDLMPSVKQFMHRQASRFRRGPSRQTMGRLWSVTPWQESPHRSFAQDK